VAQPVWDVAAYPEPPAVELVVVPVSALQTVHSVVRVEPGVVVPAWAVAVPVVGAQPVAAQPVLVVVVVQVVVACAVEVAVPVVMAQAVVVPDGLEPMVQVVVLHDMVVFH
jgi:hypothetical protein